LESSTSIQAADIKVASELQFKNVRKLLASKRVIEMLKYCDGEYTIAEMAKKANMQLSNASIYISRLREAGIVSADKKPRVLAGNIILPMELLMK
ncbi:MAG: hypothetical protein KGH69_05085, partial [Candidatus Micrarchaeota archaeon]|nr:hypothetical protein [Candidatus Micrarchaeota archaeon]